MSSFLRQFIAIATAVGLLSTVGAQAEPLRVPVLVPIGRLAHWLVVIGDRHFAVKLGL